MISGKSMIRALFVLAGLNLLIGCASSGPAAGHGEMQLPPGWTEADMQACMEAGTPGEMHEQMARGAGVWDGKCLSWMSPDMEPMPSTCKSTVKSVMGGRFLKYDIDGEMPGMGPYLGSGVIGYDNISKEFVSTYYDNYNTGLMIGTGELSADGKTMNWTFTANCPITKKPMTYREIETITGPRTKTFELFGPDPKTGKEYKIMSIEFKKR